MTDLKERLDRALTTFEPSGHALELTMDRVLRRRHRRRVGGQTLSALVVVGALVGVFTPVFHAHGGRSRTVTRGSSVSGLAIVAARSDGSVQLVSADGTVRRTLLAPSPTIASWGEPVSLSVSDSGDAVYIGYEMSRPTRYAARIERVSLEGGRPVFVADGVSPAVSPDGTELAYVREPPGVCQPSTACPPSDLDRHLIVEDLATGAARALPVLDGIDVSGLSWSVDDVHLAVSDGNGFWVVDTAPTATAGRPPAIFPPSDSILYWSDAVYRGSSGAIGAVAFCPETVGCDQRTQVLSIDPATRQATLVAELDFGTRSLTFDTSGQTFAYIGLTPGTPLPSPLMLKPCAAAVLCLGTTGSTRLTPVDTLLLWRGGTTTALGTGYVSVALGGP